MISDTIAIYELLTKKWNDYKVISALFNGYGKRIDGDKNIEIIKHDVAGNIWYFSVSEYKNFIFIRIPTNPGCVIETTGSVDGQNNDSNIFRYIAVPDGHIYGSAPFSNVKTDFMVIGYDPKTFLNIKESQ